MDRRSYLRQGALVGTVAVAGCLEGTGQERGDGSSGTNDGNGTEADGTSAGDCGDGSIESLDTGGSPGDCVPVVADGRVTLLDFWATWCAPCEPQMDELRSIRESFPDVHLLSITNERDREAVGDWWREHDGTWPTAMDPELRMNDRFDVTRIPTLLVLHGDGTEQWRHVGLAAAESIAAELEAAGA